MTEFGNAQLKWILRAQVVLAGFALALGWLSRHDTPGAAASMLVALLVITLGISIFAALQAQRFSAARLMQFLLILDFSVIVIAVYQTGGTDGGLAALYAFVPFAALVILGRAAALSFALAAGLFFIAQVILDLNGVYSAARRPVLAFEIAAQSAILVVFLTLIFAYSSAATRVARRLHQDKTTAESERALAEHTQRRWALVNTVALRVQEATTPREIYQTIGQELERSNIHCAVLEWAEPNKTLRMVYTSLFSNQAETALTMLGTNLQTLRFALSDMQELQRAISAHAPVLTRDVVSNSRALFPAIPNAILAAALRSIEMRALVVAPMMYGNDVNGVLLIFGARLNESDVAPFAALANQAASALEKGRLIAEQRKRAAHLALVSKVAAQATASADPVAMLQSLVEGIYLRFGYRHVCFSKYDAVRQEMELQAVAGENAALFEPHTRCSAARGLIGLAARTQQTIVSGNLREDPRFVAMSQDSTLANSELCVPLMTAEQVLGVLDIESLERDAFDANDVSAMETLANQMAIVLERAYTLQTERRRSAQMALVNQIAARTARLVPVRELLQDAVTLIRAQFGYFNVAVFDYAAENSGLHLLATAGGLDPLIANMRAHLERGIIRSVAIGGELYLSRDTRTDAQYHSPFASDQPDPVRSELSIPLRRDHQVLGVLDMQSEQRDAFASPDITALQVLADQLTVAIENARLYEAAARRAAEMDAVRLLALRVTAERDLDALLHSIVFSAFDLVEADGASLDLVDETRGDLLVYISHNLPRDYTGLHLQYGEGLAGMAAVQGEPIIVQDYGTWEHRVNWFPTDEYAGMLAVPLKWQNRLVGVLVLHRHRGRAAFNQAELRLTSLFAAQAAIAIENANLVHQLQARLRELNLLFEGFRATASTLDPAEVITRLLEQLARGLDVTSAYFVRIDRARGELIQTHEFFADTATPRERRVDKRAYDLAYVPRLNLLRQGISLILQADDPNLSSEEKEFLRVNQIWTMMRVPLIIGTELAGYLSVCETRAARRWNVNEMRFVETMAAQAAVALVNAELYGAAQTRSRELQALHEAGRLLNGALDMRAICELSVDALRDILGYHHVSVYFVVAEYLELQVERGYKNMLNHIPVSAGVMGRAVRTQQTIFLPDVSLEPGFLRALDDTQSEIAVPLLAGDRVLGVLNVETVIGEESGKGVWVLNIEDVQLLNTFANQLVVAIENARLFQETQQHLTELRMLHAASQALNSDIELDVVLERVAAQFISALKVDSCTLTEWDRERNQLVILVDQDSSRQLQETQGKTFPADEPLAVRVLHQKSSIVLRAADAAHDDTVREYLETYAWQSVLLLPLIGKGQVIGLVELGDRHPERTFAADDLHLATSLAVQAAIAIENAKLYRHAQQRLHETETLYRYAREFGGTLDIQTLGARALDAVARLTDFDFGAVCLLRDADHALVPLVLAGEAGSMLAAQPLPAGAGVMGWVVRHGRSARLGDVTRDPRYYDVSPHTMSEVCVPLRVGERTIGVLNLEAKAPDAFDAHAEQLLTVFANQLAIAIENARLYEQTKRDAEVKAVLLRELSHRVKNNLAAITSLLYMALDESPDARDRILMETLGRVQSMATAHALLARASEGQVDLLQVGAQVLRDTIHNLALPGAQIQIETMGDRVLVAMRQLTTLAMVLNELATNALRHGLNKMENVPLVLRFVVTRQPDNILFALQDNGMGLPPDFDLDTRAGLGLSLVHSLVEKDLHGLFTIHRRGEWTSAEVRFRLEEDAI